MRRVGSRERWNCSGVGCPPSCLHQIRNKDLLLSWLPVVCPVGRHTAGYRTPAAPTRYLSTRNEVIAGDGDDDAGIALIFVGKAEVQYKMLEAPQASAAGRA